MNMLLIKAVHLIAMVAWFAGLFYLPRLFVYHSTTTDQISLRRFELMEKRLYYAIMWPAAILTTVCGIALYYPYKIYYMQAAWMQAKLFLVVILWIYHGICGRFITQFKQNAQNHSTLFYRVWNEIPTLCLIAIIFLVVMKP